MGNQQQVPGGTQNTAAANAAAAAASNAARALPAFIANDSSSSSGSSSSSNGGGGVTLGRAAGAKFEPGGPGGGASAAELPPAAAAAAADVAAPEAASPSLDGAGASGGSSALSVNEQRRLRGTSSSSTQDAAAAAQAVSAAQSAAAAAWGGVAPSSSSSSRPDIRSLLFPSLRDDDLLFERTDGHRGTQVFIENDGSIRLDVHSSGGRGGRGRGRGQQVMSPYLDDLFGDEDSLTPSFAQRGLQQPLAAAAAAGSSSSSSRDTAVAVEELLLLERLRAAGVDSKLRSYLEESLQQQIHKLGESPALGEAFVETEYAGTNSPVTSQRAVQAYLAAFLIGFGGILLVSVIICCIRAAYVKHMKKKLEAQMAALQAGSTSKRGDDTTEATQETGEQQEEEGWVDVSVQQQKPQVKQEVQSLVSRTSMAPPSRLASRTVSFTSDGGGMASREQLLVAQQQGSMKEGAKGDVSEARAEQTENKGAAVEGGEGKKKEQKGERGKKKKEKKGKKSKSLKWENKRSSDVSDFEADDDKKEARRRHKEKELMKVLSSRRTLKLGEGS